MNLTKNCKAVLAAMQQDAPFEAYHAPEKLSELSGLNYATTLTICNTLCSAGYARWNDRSRTLITPTELGLSYKEIERSNHRNAWFDRLIGAIVGAILTCAIPHIIVLITKLLAQ